MTRELPNTPSPHPRASFTTALVPSCAPSNGVGRGDLTWIRTATRGTTRAHQCARFGTTSPTNARPGGAASSPLPASNTARLGTARLQVGVRHELQAESSGRALHADFLARAGGTETRLPELADRLHGPGRNRPHRSWRPS